MNYLYLLQKYSKCLFYNHPSVKKGVFMAFLSKFTVAVRYNSVGVVRNTRQPISVAVLYFSTSPRNPCGRVCLPCVHTPPSTSRAILCSGIAKSNRHRLSGWNLYSLTHSTPKSVLHITVKTSLICVFFAVCRLFFAILIVCLFILF